MAKKKLKIEIEIPYREINRPGNLGFLGKTKKVAVQSYRGLKRNPFPNSQKRNFYQNPAR